MTTNSTPQRGAADVMFKRGTEIILSESSDLLGLYFYSTLSTYGTPYDYMSIMHYEVSAFAGKCSNRWWIKYKLSHK